MKKILFMFILCLSIFIVSGCNSDSSSSAENTESTNENEMEQEELTLSLSHTLPPSFHTSEALVSFSEKVDERTDGKIKIDVHDSGSLGNETESIEQVMLGTLDIAIAAVGTWSSVEPQMAIEDLPYPFENREQWYDAYDGELGDYLKDLLEDNHNVKALDFLEIGMRQMTSNSPIEKPEDLEGVRIRVAQSNLRVEALESIGALPVAMSFSEVFTGLQQGTIDAQENPLAIIHSASLNEVQDNLSLTNHFFTNVVFVMNDDSWDKITPENQEIITELLAEIKSETRENSENSDLELVDTLREEGMEVNEVDTTEFREVFEPIYTKWGEEVFGEELMNIYYKYAE